MYTFGDNIFTTLTTAASTTPDFLVVDYFGGSGSGYGSGDGSGDEITETIVNNIMTLITQNPIILEHEFNSKLAHHFSPEYKSLKTQMEQEIRIPSIPGLAEFHPNPKVQRFRRAPAARSRRDNDVILTSLFYQTTYAYSCRVSDCEMVQENRADWIIEILSNSILRSLSGSELVADLPVDLDIQPTFRTEFKDPDWIDAVF